MLLYFLIYLIFGTSKLYYKLMVKSFIARKIQYDLFGFENNKSTTTYLKKINIVIVKRIYIISGIYIDFP
jgi:hypothetical protein